MKLESSNQSQTRKYGNSLEKHYSRIHGSVKSAKGDTAVLDTPTLKQKGRQVLSTARSRNHFLSEPALDRSLP